MANFALVVALDPTSKSNESFTGETAPWKLRQSPSPLQAPQAGRPPVKVRQLPFVPPAVCESKPVEVVYTIPPVLV